jgi:hypothetical protein
MDDAGTMGVWSADPDCYRFIAEHCHRGQRTLETGLGLSTVVFAALGTHHQCVTLFDGNHGFPVPMLDFLFAGGCLRAGGLIVFDDLQLPAVRLVADFCDLDDRWVRMVRTPKWGAWRRRCSGPLADDHYDQPFLTDAWVPGGGPFRVQVKRLVAHAARGLRRRLSPRSSRRRR